MCLSIPGVVVSHCQVMRSDFIRAWEALLNKLISLPNSETFIELAWTLIHHLGKATVMTAMKLPEHIPTLRAQKYRSITNLQNKITVIHQCSKNSVKLVAIPLPTWLWNSSPTYSTIFNCELTLNKTIRTLVCIYTVLRAKK